MFQAFKGAPATRAQKLAAAVLIAVLAAAAPVCAAELASAWSDGPLSRVRLIGGTQSNGQWRAGVEILLKGEAHTYWRSPGDSGVPPVFDFAGSKNLAKAIVRYPVPERMSEAGMQIFGYKGEVIFPLEIAATEANKPVTVVLHLAYAACEKVCMPTEARMSLVLDPRRVESTLGARIADYEQRTPKPLNSPDAPAISLTPGAGAGKPVWQAKLSPPPDATSDLFVEGPDGWIFDTKSLGAGLFEISQAEKPSGAKALPPVTVTVATSSGAFEGVLHLDARAPTP